MNHETLPPNAGLEEIDELRLVLRSRRYELGGQIGAGGMGAVFEGRHLLLDRPVAIKLLTSLTHRGKSSFMAEGRALAKLRHPNLVEIYDLDLIGEVPYLVMELLRGETLETRLTQRGRLPLAEACAVMRQVLRGLGAAHSQGIVHRDVKPANIFLTPGPASTEIAKLLDFGISGRAGAAGEVIGTAHYLAPEQIKGEMLDVRTDLWAFGVTLYEMLTGAVPFAGDTVERLFAAIRDDAPQPASARNPDLPPYLDKVLGRLLAKRPADRFATVAELESACSFLADSQANITVSEQESYALIAVGDPSRAAIIKAAVGELGLLGVVVDDGAEAIEFLREVGPASLAIIDLNLPRKTGFDVVRKIRSGPHGASVRILAISLVSTLTDALVGQDLAVDEVLESWSPLALERSAQRVLKGEGRGRSSRPAEAQTRTADPARLKAVHSLGVVDEEHPQDQELAQLMQEVADAFSVPIAMISFILEDRQWFKAHVGVGGALLKARGTPLEQSFCRHVVDSGEPLVVPDAAAHPAFHDHALVVGGIVGSYLGAPVGTTDGNTIGTLCIIDEAPHAFSARDVDDLTVLARRVAGELAVRSRSIKSGDAPADAAFIELDEHACVALATPAFLELFGRSTGELLGVTREKLLSTLAPQFADPVDFVRRTRVGRGPFIAYGDFELLCPRRQRVRWLAKPVTELKGGHRIQELFVALK